LKQGRNFVKLQRPDDAQAAFLNAIARDATLADAHFQLGKIAASRSDHATAIPRFERAVAADPSLKEAWYQLSLSYRRAGNTEKAAAALERFKKLQ
ncbi:MAG: tetratricopeptide repeat protein, partial [Bryobacterales bacterium]|nr:tetratricopeptide repeat protein [Bryobacterales bacterium]